LSDTQPESRTPFRRREGGFGGGGGRDRGFDRPRRFEGPSGPPQIDYRGLVEFVAKSLAEDPDSVQVDSVDRPGGAIAIKVKMSETDVGRLIGKSGRNIEALRTLVRVASLRERRKVFVDLA
jgi:predicted RNA-binding protein YlqC (UPF0109 family)